MLAKCSLLRIDFMVYTNRRKSNEWCYECETMDDTTFMEKLDGFWECIDCQTEREFISFGNTK